MLTSRKTLGHMHLTFQQCFRFVQWWVRLNRIFFFYIKHNDTSLLRLLYFHLSVDGCSICFFPYNAIGRIFVFGKYWSGRTIFFPLFLKPVFCIFVYISPMIECRKTFIINIYLRGHWFLKSFYTKCSLKRTTLGGK